MKRLLAVSFFTALLTLVRMACGFVIAKVVALYTGPSGMAALGQVQNLINALNGLVTAPAGSGVVRYTAEHREQGFAACAPWWSASLQWVTGLVLIVVPVSFFLSDYLSTWLFGYTGYAWLIVVASCILPLSAINTFIASIINGLQLYRRYVIVGMLSALLSTGVMIILIVQANLNGALIAAAAISGISGIVMLASSLRQPWFKLKYLWGQAEAKQRKDIGSYVLMAMASAIVASISLVLVRNVLIAEVGWGQAGQWEAVRRVSEVYLAIITMALGTYFLPHLASLKGGEVIRKEIQQAAKVIMPLVSLMAVAIYLLRDIAITLLFTEEFREARDLFAIQLCADVIKILSWLYAYPMLSRGAVKWLVATEVIFSITYVSFSYLFVDKYGVQGAPLASLINYLLYFVFIYANFKNFAR